MEGQKGEAVYVGFLETVIIRRKHHARIRNLFPARRIFRRLHSTRCSTCCRSLRDSRRRDGRIYGLDSLPYDYPAFVCCACTRHAKTRQLLGQAMPSHSLRELHGPR
jgi:hypothetical protein